MGWHWQNGWQSNGHQAWWSNDWRNNWGSKPKGPARRPSPSPSWGLWRCQCGNTQSGSQCKNCKAKWWEVEWNKVSPPGQTPDPPKAEQSHKPAERSALAALDDLFHRLPPGDDAHSLVEGLRELLRGRAPAQSTRQKLKSVLDKLDHQRTRAKNLRQELKATEEKKAKLEKDILETENQVKTLEEEKNSLVYVVGPDGPAVEEDEESPTDPGPPGTPGILSEEETAQFMQRMNPRYLNRMLQAEIDRLRGDGSIVVPPPPGGGAIPGDPGGAEVAMGDGDGGLV